MAEPAHRSSYTARGLRARALGLGFRVVRVRGRGFRGDPGGLRSYERRRATRDLGNAPLDGRDAAGTCRAAQRVAVVRERRRAEDLRGVDGVAARRGTRRRSAARDLSPPCCQELSVDEESIARVLTAFTRISGAAALAHLRALIGGEPSAALSAARESRRGALHVP